MRRWLTLAVLAPLMTASAAAAPAACSTAVLRNGFSMQYLRKEAAGAATRLWVCAGENAGYVEIPSEQIAGFEEQPSAAAPAAAPAATAETKDAIPELISSAAWRHQIDPDFVASVVEAESGFNPKAVSPRGAQGLMQLMPQTAARLGVENVLDPSANLEGGTKYLRELLDRYGGDAVRALAAYNAGAQRVEQYGGIPPYHETQAYVAKVLREYGRKKQRAASR